jgi:hypothetical protein
VVRINHKGDIYRCGGKTPLGSIVSGEFRRMNPLTPCSEHFCPYYCTKYSIAPPAPVQASRRSSAPVIELMPV